MAFELIAILLAFVIIMAGVLWTCLAARRRERGQSALDAEARTAQGARRDETGDNRIALIIFGGIMVGALLALTTAWLVFFRTP
jgi:hypothetical protein